jgi:guanylate kinase
LGNAAKELEYGHGEGNFDLVLVNDDLEKSFQELVTNVKKWYPHLEEKKKEE